MAASSNSRPYVSLFDQELNDLLCGVRIITKDLGHGTGNGEQLELWNKEHNHEKGNVQCNVQIG